MVVRSDERVKCFTCSTIKKKQTVRQEKRMYNIQLQKHVLIFHDDFRSVNLSLLFFQQASVAQKIPSPPLWRMFLVDTIIEKFTDRFVF